MIFKMTDKKLNFWEGEAIFYLGVYNKYWLDKTNKVKNPKFDEFSNNILNLKNLNQDHRYDHERAIVHFFNEVNPILGNDFPITVVPSHDPNQKEKSGILELAERLSRVNGRIDATHCLRRIHRIPSLHGGGYRSEILHFSSIKLYNLELIEGRDVLLLDDVATTGGSMSACRKILMRSGVKSVTCLALAKDYFLQAKQQS
jgi:predicted amidophosphoribosyltransferase